MTVKKLNWFRFDDGKGYVALVPEFGISYAIWFEEGKTFSGCPTGDNIPHASKEEAILYCQTDFQKNVLALLE